MSEPDMVDDMSSGVFRVSKWTLKGRDVERTFASRGGNGD